MTPQNPNGNSGGVADNVHQALARFGILPIESLAGPKPASARDVRRGIVLPQKDDTRVVTLVKDDEGVLRWRDGTVPSQPGVRRRAGLLRLFGGEPVTTMKFAPIGENKIAAELASLDEGFKKFEPEKPASVRVIRNRALADAAEPLNWDGQGDRKKVLLFVHGTFSNNDNLIEEILRCPAGGPFLDAAEQHYDQVLAFDHHTLSRGPVLNALDLARSFGDTKTDIDIICHSRGGLVTRWFFEVMDRVSDRRLRRAVLVGCPLSGTSLAAPDKLRGAIDLFTNIGSLLGDGASLIPFLSAAGAIMKVCCSVVGAVSKVPLIDAGVAMIPGLAGQSRVVNSFELRALGFSPKAPPVYYAVTSEFRPADIGWKFWRIFCDWKQAAGAATGQIFGEANDLVVDTAAMDDFMTPGVVLAGQPEKFGEGEGIYHTIYFRQPRTIEFIRKSLGF